MSIEQAIIGIITSFEDVLSIRGKAAIYCRVSTDNQESEGTSLPTQLEACLKHCQDKGYCENNDENTNRYLHNVWGDYANNPNTQWYSQKATSTQWEHTFEIDLPKRIGYNENTVN